MGAVGDGTDILWGASISIEPKQNSLELDSACTYVRPYSINSLSSFEPEVQARPWMLTNKRATERANKHVRYSNCAISIYSRFTQTLPVKSTQVSIVHDIIEFTILVRNQYNVLSP